MVGSGAFAAAPPTEAGTWGTLPEAAAAAAAGRLGATVDEGGGADVGALGGMDERSGAFLLTLKASSTRAPPSVRLLILRAPPNRV